MLDAEHPATTIAVVQSSPARLNARYRIGAPLIVE